MELRHLRYFTAVAKHLNLSEASPQKEANREWTRIDANNF
jgi:hypothetical protein